jgi:hypothetical protein
MYAIRYLALFQYCFQRKDHTNLTTHFHKMIRAESNRQFEEDILVEGLLKVSSPNAAFPVLHDDATPEDYSLCLRIKELTIASPVLRGVPVPPTIQVRLDDDSDFPMDAENDDYGRGDQDMQFSHTRSQAAAATLGRDVLLTQEEQASTVNSLSQSAEHTFNEVMALCKEAYKVIEGDVTAVAALKKTLKQSYLDSVERKAREEQVRATYEDGSETGGLHLSANGTSKLRSAKRFKACGNM